MYVPLYEINQKLMEAFDEETGELLIPEEELDAIFEAEKNGINYFMGLYKNASATAICFEAEAKKQKKRADAYKRIAQKAFERIEKHMEGNSFESEVGTISYRKSTRCEQFDEMAFLQWDGRFEYGSSDFVPDKTAIKEAIKSGKEVPGWSNNDYLNMSIN